MEQSGIGQAVLISYSVSGNTSKLQTINPEVWLEEPVREIATNMEQLTGDEDPPNRLREWITSIFSRYVEVTCGILQTMETKASGIVTALHTGFLDEVNDALAKCKGDIQKCIHNMATEFDTKEHALHTARTR